MLKFISAVMAAAAIAGGLMLLSFAWLYHGDEKSRPDIDVAAEQTGSTPAGQKSARDAAPQSTPVTQTAPAPAAAAISPKLVLQFEDMARNLAVMRISVEQLAAKQEQMAHNIAILQALEGDLAVVRHSVEQLAAKQEQMTQNIATRQAAEQDIIPKKRQGLRHRNPPRQSSSVPPPAFLPQ